MTWLHFFFIISGTIIFIVSLNIARKQRFSAFLFLIFLSVWILLFVFSFFPKTLDDFWKIFWVTRWADVLVYISVIFLIYVSLLLLSKIFKNNEDTTKLIREIAIEKSVKTKIVWKEVILIRAFNEAKVIAWVLEELIQNWYKNILVINDGSTDETQSILENFWEKIVFVSHATNRGAWAALETGFEYLRRFWKIDYVITFDADWQHLVSDIKKFDEKFDKDAELWAIFGSRFLEKSKTNVPFFRKVILHLWKIFTFFVSWIYLTDTHNWLRWFRFETIKKIHLKMDSMAYASELIEEIRKKKIKYAEVFVVIKYTDYSLWKWQSSLNAINIALKVIFNKFFK